MNDLTSKNAVITGGNSGIGFATAKKFKQSGANVIITGKSSTRVQKAAKELGVKGIVADVRKLSALDELVSQVSAEFNKVDILFVNAGIFITAPVGESSEQMFDNQMDINFKGAVFSIEKLLPLLNEGASIINLASIIANAGMSQTAIYAASKAALNAYTRIAAIELAQRNIRVNSVNPGPIATPLLEKTGMSQEMLDGFADAIQKRVPLKRFGDPGDVANLVAFLASDDSSYITGSEINIDGGLYVNQIL